MSLRTADHLDAIRHLPAGATLTFHAFAWDEYERLLEDLSDKSHVRVSYDHGKLEVTVRCPNTKTTRGCSTIWFVRCRTHAI